MGIMAGIGGAVGGLAGLFGGGANNVQLPPMFNMPNMGGAANNAYGAIGGLGNFTGAAGGTLPFAGQTFGNLYNNPYAPGFQQGANTAGMLGQGAALGGYNTGQGVVGLGQSMIPGAQAVLNTAFDPQQQLYSYLQGQNQQQQEAINAASGIAATPYGAGVTGQSNQLFNMNWQDRQLGRQESGLNAYGTALGQSGALQNLGTGMMNAAPGQYFNASMMPYGAYGAIGAGQNQAIGQYLGNITGAMGPQENQIGNYLGYLSAGNTANSVANQNAALQLQQQQQNFNQQMMFGGMLGGSLYGLGQGFGFGGANGSMLGNMMGFGGGLGGTYVNGAQVPYGSINYNPIQQQILSGYG